MPVTAVVLFCRILVVEVIERERRSLGVTWIHLLLIRRIRAETTAGGRGPQENFANGQKFFQGMGAVGRIGG